MTGTSAAAAGRDITGFGWQLLTLVAVSFGRVGTSGELAAPRRTSSEHDCHP
jgi:hypothetical protein